MSARHSRNLSSGGLRSSTFTRLRDSNHSSELFDGASFSSSPDIYKYSTETFGRRRIPPPVRHDSSFSSIFLNAGHHEEFNRIEKKNLKMEEQLKTFKSSSKASKSQEFKDESSQNSTFPQGNSSLTFPSISRPSVATYLNSKTQSDNETSERDSIKLIPIGVYDLDPFMPNSPNIPTNATTARTSRSRSLARPERNYNHSFSHLKRQPFVNGDSLPKFSQMNNNGNFDSWYKPNFSRDCAINYLIDKPRGYFVLRKSSTHPASYVLALKTEEHSAHRYPKDKQASVSIKHFLIDASQKGFRFKGFTNEPEFESLEALVEHYKKNDAILPCKLAGDIHADGNEFQWKQKNSSVEFDLQYMTSVFTEVDSCLDTMKRAFDICYNNRNRIKRLMVLAQLNSAGVSILCEGKLSQLKRFYTYDEIVLCCVDPFVRQLTSPIDCEGKLTSMFGFLTRGLSREEDGCVHIFTMQNMNEMTRFINQIMSRKESTMTSFH